MPADEQLINKIVEQAQQPAQAEFDGNEVRQHNPKDLIEVDRYQRSIDAVDRGRRGIRLSKIVPPGAC